MCAAAEQLGVTEGALALTASYAKTREQFGRPIGTFQAVSQRLADGFIDVLAQRLTLWQAVWRLQEGLPASTEVAVAKLWAADAGHRLAHTTVHVHGGVGIDLDGDAHRYFTTAKRFEFLFGGATDQALTIGRALASDTDNDVPFHSRIRVAVVNRTRPVRAGSRFCPTLLARASHHSSTGDEFGDGHVATMSTRARLRTLTRHARRRALALYLGASRTRRRRPCRRRRPRPPASPAPRSTTSSCSTAGG